MGQAIDISGKKFFRLTALNPTSKRADKKIIWEFICDCGATHYATAKSVKSGNTKSCGCYKKDFSRIHADKMGKSKVKKECLVCFSVFFVKKSHDERSKYCSVSCRNRGYSERHFGDRNQNWKGGVSSDKDYITQRARKWRAKNPSKISHYNRIRKARRKGAKGQYTDEDVNRIYKMQNGKCSYCYKKVGKTYHVDHVVPLALGGSNSKENICISCPECNLRKGAMDPIEWASKIGRLL